MWEGMFTVFKMFLNLLKYPIYALGGFLIFLFYFNRFLVLLF